MHAVVKPLPMDDTTPPVMKMYFVGRDSIVIASTPGEVDPGKRAFNSIARLGADDN
jgi:hypothetical protein